MKTKQSGQKVLNCRHGHGSRRSCNAVEKAIETAQRREWRLGGWRSGALLLSLI